jgi:hypothetical protein
LQIEAPQLRDPLTRGFLKEKGNDLRSALATVA